MEETKPRPSDAEPRKRRTPVQTVQDNLPRLTLDELAAVCAHLVAKHPRQAVALGAMLEENAQSGRGQKIRGE